MEHKVAECGDPTGPLFARLDPDTPMISSRPNLNLSTSIQARQLSRETQGSRQQELALPPPQWGLPKGFLPKSLLTSIFLP